MYVKVAQSYPTLCNPMDYTVYGLLNARILEWVAFPFSRGSSQPRDQTQVFHIAGKFFTSWAIREALYLRIPDAKNCLFGKNLDSGEDWSQEEKGTTEVEMVG